MVATTLSFIVLAQATGQTRPVIRQAQRLPVARKMELVNAAAKKMGITTTFRQYGPSKILTTRNGYSEGNGYLKFGSRCTEVNYYSDFAKFPSGPSVGMETGFQLFFGSKAPSGFYVVDVEVEAQGSNILMSAISNRTTSGGNATTTYETTLPYSGISHFIFVVQTYEASAYRVDVSSAVDWKFLSAEVSRLE